MMVKRLACVLLLPFAALAQQVPAGPQTSSQPPAVHGSEAGAIRVLLAPAVETVIASQMAGRVRDVSVKLGDRFTRGKVLVRFDCDEQAARMKMAEAELASARENHQAKLRLQGLQQAGEVEVSLAASAVDKGNAQVALFRAQLGQCVISAPFSGRVVKLAVKPFQGVTAGQPVMELVGDGPLKLRVNAPAKWIAWLKPGLPFEVAIDETGKKYSARVSAVNARVDAVSQTIELEATIDQKAPDLLPGMSGVARLAPPR